MGRSELEAAKLEAAFRKESTDVRWSADTTKLEGNLSALQAAAEASKPKAQKTAEAVAAAKAVSPAASTPASK